MAKYRISNCFVVFLSIYMITINNTSGSNLVIVSSKDKHTVFPRRIGLHGDFTYRLSNDNIDHRSRRDVNDEKLNFKSFVVDSQISTRFSETTLDSEVENPFTTNQDVSFVVQIPETAFISNFTMVINGEFHVAKVKSKEDAQREFVEARQQNKTAGMVSNKKPAPHEVQRGMELFSVAVTVSAGTSTRFQLTYLQALVRTLGEFEQKISIRPGQVVDQLSVSVTIDEEQGIKSLQVFEPPLTNSLENQYTSISQTGDTRREIVYTPSKEAQQLYTTEAGISGDLVIRYDVNHPYDIGNVQVEDNYFVHHFSPDDTVMTVLDKNIVFVIDISGSMRGRKIEQTREAMLSILGWLNSGDRFMIILFDDALEYWPAGGEQLVAVTVRNIEEAKYFVQENVVASGGTNINLGLVTAADQLSNLASMGGNIIVFLTDGHPTSGVRLIDEIVSNVVSATEERSSIYSLGFGFSLNWELLQKLSYRTNGFAVRIYEETDATSQLTKFFKGINNPLLFNIEFKYPSAIIVENGITTTFFSNYFEGTELTIAGQLIEDAPQSWEVELVAKSGSSDFTMSKTVDTTMILPTEANDAFPQAGFVEKLYVYMKIKDLLKQELITDDSQLKEEYKMQALELALEYSLVTPLTSMIIIQRDEPDMQDDEYKLMTKSAGGRRIPDLVSLSARGVAIYFHTSNIVMMFCISLAHYI